jgi:hypothetical protein
LPDFYWHNLPNWEKYQMAAKYSKWSKKCTNIFRSKAIQNIPNLYFFV